MIYFIYIGNQRHLGLTINNSPQKTKAMASDKRSIFTSGASFGLLTAAALIAYFLLMSLLGFHRIVELRFLNGIIVTVGICWALYKYKKEGNGKINYFNGLGLGFTTAGVAALLFGIFMMVYVTFINSEFITTLSTNLLLGDQLSAILMFAVIMVEGLISGFLIAFIAMQYFKTDEHDAA